MLRELSSASAARRMRLFRKRRRNGLHCLRVLLHDSEIDGLVQKGYLQPERRGDLKAVENALDHYVLDLGPQTPDLES